MPARAAHQIVHPMTVISEELGLLISARPAAREMKDRTRGTRRPNSTTHSPRPSNQASARSRSLWVNRMYLPNRSTSGRPPK